MACLQRPLMSGKCCFLELFHLLQNFWQDPPEMPKSPKSKCQIRQNRWNIRKSWWNIWKRPEKNRYDTDNIAKLEIIAVQKRVFVFMYLVRKPCVFSCETQLWWSRERTSQFWQPTHPWHPSRPPPPTPGLNKHLWLTGSPLQQDPTIPVKPGAPGIRQTSVMLAGLVSDLLQISRKIGGCWAWESLFKERKQDIRIT